MELIEGPSLDAVLKQLRTSLSGGRKPPENADDSGDLRPPLRDGGNGGLAATGPYVKSADSLSDSDNALTSSSRKKLERLTPTTAEDFVLRGWHSPDASAAMRDMDEAIQKRDTPIARVVRAGWRSERAL